MGKIPARWLEAGRQRVQAREQHLELMLLRWDVFQADASLTLFLLRGLECVLGTYAGICPAPTVTSGHVCIWSPVERGWRLHPGAGGWREQPPARGPTPSLGIRSELVPLQLSPSPCIPLRRPQGCPLPFRVMLMPSLLPPPSQFQHLVSPWEDGVQRGEPSFPRQVVISGMRLEFNSPVPNLWNSSSQPGPLPWPV